MTGHYLEDLVHWLVLSLPSAIVLDSWGDGTQQPTHPQMVVKGRNKGKEGRKTGGEREGGRKQGSGEGDYRADIHTDHVRGSRTEPAGLGGWRHGPSSVNIRCHTVPFLGWSQMVAGAGELGGPCEGQLIPASGSHRWRFCLSGPR